jgi:hypothetical protein
MSRCSASMVHTPSSVVPLVWNRQKQLLGLPGSLSCACVRVCVCACVRVCACGCAREQR